MAQEWISAKATGKRIGFFLPDLTGGGAERVMLNLAQGFSDLGHECDLVLVNAHGEYLDQVGTRLRIVNLASARALTSLPALVRYLKQERPAALLAALGHTNIMALLAVKLARVGTRVLVSEHLAYGMRYTTRATIHLFPLLARILYPTAHTVVAVSNGVADTFSEGTRFPREQIKVIYNPVITPELLSQSSAGSLELLPDNGRPFILAVGRLSRQKDFTLLIKAFASVRQQHDLCLLILGEGEERGKLERLVAECGLKLGEDVFLPGFAANPYPYMKQCEVFVLSSESEGLPTVLIEALACGARVVSTDCPSGPREILLDGKLGRLVPVGDTEALSRAITATLQTGRSGAADIELGSFTQDFAVRSYLEALSLT